MQQTPYGSTQTPDRIRRTAWLSPVVQIGIGLVGSGICAGLSGRPAAVAFLVGAVVVAVGFAIFGWRTTARPPVVPAGRAFARLLVGTLLKWLVIGAGLALAMTAAGTAAEFVLGGAVTACLAYLLSLPWLLR